MLNNAFLEVIQSTPLCQAYGTDNDISPMLYFSFYKPVYYLVDETTFPSKSKERCGQWVGVSENVGHFMTYKILTDDTHRIIHRSNNRLVADPNARNLHLDPLNDKLPEVIWSLRKASPASDHGEEIQQTLFKMTIDQGGGKLLHIKTGLVLRPFESFYNYFIRFAVILIQYRITDS
jgi:hypothetical protein